MAGWFIDIFVEYIFRVFFHAMNLVRSRKWPIVKATVLSADCPRATYGCEVATVYYEYAINGEKYGEDYAALFVKGLQFKVRVKPDDPTKSVPLWAPPSMG